MFLGFRKLMEDEEQGLLGKLALGTGVTVGGVSVYELFEFAKQNPVMIVNLIKSFGAEFVIAVIVLAMMNRMVGVMEKNSTSNQEMADAMRQIANKDDRQAERMELAISYAAQQGQESKQTVTEILKRIGLQDSALDRIEHNQAMFMAGQQQHVEKGS